MGKVQAGIFAEHGLASALALPPMIPIAFLPGAPVRGLLEDLEGSVRAGWRVRVAGCAWVEGCLFAVVETGGLWAALRAAAIAAAGEGPRGPFPAAEGFCLGCTDAEPAARPRIVPALPELAFSSCTLAAMRFESPRQESDWWRELYWETIDEKPLRGRRGP